MSSRLPATISRLAASRSAGDSRKASSSIGMFLRSSGRDSASTSGLSGSARNRSTLSRQANDSSSFGGRNRSRSVPGGITAMVSGS